MKIWLAYEIMVSIAYWQKTALILYADTVEPAVLILVYTHTKYMQVAEALASLQIYTGSAEP